MSDELTEVFNQIKDLQGRVGRLESKFETDKPILDKKISIKEFILSKNPTNEVEKTLVIGYFIEKFEGVPSFNSSDLEEGFRSAKEPVPENINYKVIKNIQRCFLMEAKEKKDGKKAWHLTNSGEQNIENGLQEKK